MTPESDKHDDDWLKVLTGIEGEDDGDSRDARHARALRTAIGMSESDDMNEAPETVEANMHAEQSWIRMRSKLEGEGLLEPHPTAKAARDRRFLLPLAAAASLVLCATTLFLQFAPEQEDTLATPRHLEMTTKDGVIPQIVFVEGAAKEAAQRFAKQLQERGLSAQLISEDAHHYVKADIEGKAASIADLLETLGIPVPQGARLVVDFMTE